MSGRYTFCFIFLIVVAISMVSLRADEEGTRNELSAKAIPWFTGPLIAPSGYTVAPKNFNLEPYVYFTVNTGTYNKHWHVHSTPNFYSVNLQVQAKVGLLKRLDFQFYPQVVFNETQGRHYANIGDLPIAFNIQLLRSQIQDSWPALKLSLRTNIPLGKYQHLKAYRKRTDAIGAGSWLPGVALIFSKLWNLSGIHFLEARLALSEQIGTPIHVKGLNTYGGTPRTHGMAYPGNSFSADGSIQYNFNQRWVFACDLIYAHTNKNRFSGKVGKSSNGAPARVKSPSNEQWSVAPAIEYNWSQNIGMIAGGWCSFAGRNSTQFASGVMAINIYL